MFLLTGIAGLLINLKDIHSAGSCSVIQCMYLELYNKQYFTV